MEVWKIINLNQSYKNLEIIGKKKLYILLKSKNFKNFCNIMKPFGATTASKPNFYYIVYDMQTFTLSIIISYHIVVGLFVMLG